MRETRKGLAAIGLATRHVALPDATGRDLARLIMPVEGTNPNRLSEPHPGAAPAGAVRLPESDRVAPASPKARTLAHRGATGRDTALPQTQFEKTNPFPADSTPISSSGPDKPLTTRQLAAVRLLLEGMTCSDVARRLGTIRQTVHRWKHLPAFAAELRRLHELVVLHREGGDSLTDCHNRQIPRGR